ncbi:hypothetical protein ACTWPB_29050 [Nocardia sp. IBHARD005]|uniref:hypothetical protein n=1 Tax=Nocardia sp. IBHARD005 TaxID=3457765 RepID=UPI0040591B21
MRTTPDYLGVPRTGDAASVDGWTCEPQPDTAVPHVCVNQGLTIGLRGNAAPATPPPPAPTPIRTVNPTLPPVTTTSSVPPVPPPLGRPRHRTTSELTGQVGTPRILVFAARPILD